MIAEPAYSRLAAQVLKRRPAETSMWSSSRDAAVANIAQAIAERAHRVRRRRILLRWASLAAAAGLMLGLSVMGASQLAEPVGSAGAECPGGPPCTAPQLASWHVGRFRGHEFGPGQAVVSGPGEHSAIEFPTGTKVTVQENTKLDYQPSPSTQRFRLARGRLHLSVAKMRLGQRLVVQTPDAEVEVHGTVFAVAVAPRMDGCHASRTRVSVEEGVVEVRADGQSHRLSAGASWPPPCSVSPSAVDQPVAVRGTHHVLAAAHVPSESSPPSSKPVEKHSGSAATPVPEPVAAEPPQASERDVPPPARPPPVVSALTEQNDLFLAAQRARRDGHLRRALADYDLLLRRYPDGPLAEAALVERMRLSRELRPARAVEEARDYLGRFPTGFGRREASEMLEGP